MCAKRWCYSYFWKAKLTFREHVLFRKWYDDDFSCLTFFIMNVEWFGNNLTLIAHKATFQIRCTSCISFLLNIKTEVSYMIAWCKSLYTYIVVCSFWKQNTFKGEMKDIISILPWGRGSHSTEMYENISNICFNVNHLSTLSYMFKNRIK